MCGIAGFINHPSIDYALLSSALKHRGPDAQTLYSDDKVTFIHTRLAIQDAKLGAQPFEYDDFVLVFNGEIYNHIELRDELKEFVFKTHSDTETLLYLYVKFGQQMLDKLDGMFAFAIYNKKSGEIFLARDRVGEKPLYIYEKENFILFSSELGAIASVVELNPNRENIQAYIRLGLFQSENTPYEDVQELKAGHYSFVDISKPRVVQKSWWRVGDFYRNKSSITFEEAVNKTDELLHKSVRRRIESSDLEVGTFLSGGIDSGLVTAIASKYVDKLKTFTVSFEGAYDEAPLAKLVADSYGTEHTEISISFANLRDDIEKIILNYGEPFFDSSAIPSFYVSKEAKKHLTVILNGDGADELFGGYRRYVPARYIDIFSKKRSIAKALDKILPPAHKKKSLYNYLYRLNSMLAHEGLDSYLRATMDIIEGYEHIFIEKSSLKQTKELLEKSVGESFDSLSAMMRMDFETILSGDLLVKMDIATMAHSLESRTVFLSKELLEFAPTLPSSFKIRGTTTKYLLRELATKYLPDALINQPKRGFEIPLKGWIDNELKEAVFDRIKNKNSYWREYLKSDFIDRLIERKILISDEKRAKILYNLYALEVWYAHYIMDKKI